MACPTDGRKHRGDAAFLCPAQPFQPSQTGQECSTDPAPPLQSKPWGHPESLCSLRATARCSAGRVWAPAALWLSDKAMSVSCFTGEGIYEMTGCSVNLWLAREHASSVAAGHSRQKPFAAVGAGRCSGRFWRSAHLPVAFTSCTLHSPCSLTPILLVPSSWFKWAGAGAACVWASPLR